MYLRSFLCEEAKINQRTFLKNQLCEIGEEAIWEFRFTSFFNFFLVRIEKKKQVFTTKTNWVVFPDKR